MLCMLEIDFKRQTPLDEYDTLVFGSNTHNDSVIKYNTPIRGDENSQRRPDLGNSSGGL